MVVIGIGAVPGESISGCAGDCFTCHPALENDPAHKALGTCFPCHDSSGNNLLLMPKSNLNGGCGDRCFQCHNEWPRNAYHDPLDTCLECHDR